MCTGDEIREKNLPLSGPTEGDSDLRTWEGNSRKPTVGTERMLSAIQDYCLEGQWVVYRKMAAMFNIKHPRAGASSVPSGEKGLP